MPEYLESAALPSAASAIFGGDRATLLSRIQRSTAITLNRADRPTGNAAQVHLPSTVTGSPQSSVLKRLLGRSLDEFVGLSPAERAREATDAVPDLHAFIDEAQAPQEREAPARTRELAASLLKALQGMPTAEANGQDADSRLDLPARVITNEFLREECDHDQNVYMGKLFTRRLTKAVPDLVFMPNTLREASFAMIWARENDVPTTLRGAASTAMGGAVPADAGLVLDLSHLDGIEILPGQEAVRIGAGVRMRPLHAKLRKAGRALPVFPSNLGGTFAGWLASGGIGLNAYARGRALDVVRSARLILPRGEMIWLDRDGGLRPLGTEQVLRGPEKEAWFSAHSYECLDLELVAGSEGQLALIGELELETEALQEISAFLLAFDSEAEAHAAVEWVSAAVSRGLDAPADLILTSASHLHHMQRVWNEEDRRPWRATESMLSGDEQLPWKKILSAADLGHEAPEPDLDRAEAFLFLDFFGSAAGQAFLAELQHCPGNPQVANDEGVRFASERFRPQQSKRFGPGLLAAEILMPRKHVPGFMDAADRMSRNIGQEFDAEVYYLAGDWALVLAAYLVDHRRGSFAIDLMLAPAFLDLAEQRFEGKPYVLGRWQAPHFGRKYDGPQKRQLEVTKRRSDPGHLLGRGAVYDMGLRGVLGALVRATMVPGTRFLRHLMHASPLFVKPLRKLANHLGGPAEGRGASAGESPLPASTAVDGDLAASRALNCVNCGECNSVCPIFNESKIRLPQMLTHLGEANYAGESMGATGETLLDLCMRCGNCEEVCQAGIPHLPLYDHMQAQVNGSTQPDRERHTLLLERLRSSPSYVQDFLDIRPGGYIKRAEAALPGSARFLLMREEGEKGPLAACIHCAACVDVCPTGANREYEGDDPRWITTLQERCIGCGTCVEICPANLANGGQTLRVMEAPSLDWFSAIEEFASLEANGQ